VPGYSIAPMPPIRSSRGRWRRAATILGTQSLRSNSDFQTLQWRQFPSSHKMAKRALAAGEPRIWPFV
jgi:hypothetical protein